MSIVPSIDRIETLFHAALEVPAGPERTAWVEAHARSGDERHEILSLLESYDAMESTRFRPSAPAVPEARFGVYHAVALLAHGGMSSVYRAERTEGGFQQTVALKVMACWLASPEFQRRFESERRFLASLEHPNITRLLDGGISSGGDPYLVTEYVDGRPLDSYCDERRFPIEQRLRLFLQVCHAVGFAHRNMIVHRDLKPANILVNRDGTVKLLDFGTASLTAADEAAVTRMHMLTPRYASPEQLRGDRTGVASDVFALGVILYELLAGAWPFGDSARTRPAAPLAGLVTPEAAQKRAIGIVGLRKLLSGDLASVVEKAIAPEPDLRYESVGTFAADIEDWLAGLPVRDKPPSFAYRARKFLRRRWLPVAAAAVCAAGLLTATAVAIYQARIARKEAARAERISKFAKDTFFSATPALFSSLRGQSRAIQFTDVLENALERVESELRDDPLAAADMRGTIADTFAVLGDNVKGEAQMRIAIDRLEKSGHGQSAVGADLYEGLCMVVSYQGRYREALEACRKSVALARVYGSTNNTLAGLIHDVAYMEIKSGGSLAEAEQRFREALTMPPADPHLARVYPAILNTRIASLRLRLGDLREGDALLDDAERRLRAEPGPPLDIIPTLAARAFSARIRGDYSGAERYLEVGLKLLAERPVSYYSADELGMELAADEALAGSPGALARLQKVERAVRAGTESAVDRIRYDLLAGITEAHAGSRDRAESIYRSALATAEKETPLQPSVRVEILLRLTELLQAEARTREAGDTARRGLDVAREAYGAFFENHPFVAKLKTATISPAVSP
jgi:tetratricopeptide (TPR) repeat protein